METIESPVIKPRFTTRKLAKELGIQIIGINRFFRHVKYTGPLTRSQANVLFKLTENRVWRVSDLALVEGVRVPSMTELIKKMQSQGLVDKTDSTDDLRGVEITITKEGRKLIKEHMVQDLHIIAERVATLSEEEKYILEKAIPVIARLFNV